MSMKLAIDVVIVNWNSGDLLRTCLRSLGVAAREAAIDVRVYVVDNASRDWSADHLPLDCPLTIIKNSDNKGFGRACNQGAAAGDAALLLFLNPDTEVRANALTQPCQFLRDPAHAHHAVCGIQLRDEGGAISRSCARFPKVRHLLCTSLGLAQALPRFPLGIAMTDWDHSTSQDVDHVIGAFYLIRRDVFNRLGGFDERYFVYLEDLDLSLRVTQAGYRLHYLAAAEASHIGGGSSRQVKARRLFYSIDSRLVYIKQHFSGLTYAAFWPVVFGLEPLMRLIGALAKFNFTAAQEVLAAYRLLWAKHLRLAPAVAAAADRESSLKPDLPK